MTSLKAILCLFVLATPGVFAASTPRSNSSQPGNPESGLFSRAIQHFGGQVVDPAQFTNNLDGFERYLAASGVRAFNARELTHPNHPEVAAKFGFTSFLPPQSWWPRGVALALLAQNLEHRVGEPVSIRNWWRPPAYNRDPKIGGAERGDHLGAFSIDLDYLSSRTRRRAEQWLHSLARSQQWLQLSLGLGDRSTHIGILSPRGHREWHYPSYLR
ncbi:MAG: hypothetical protein JWO48_1976 [Bryobacterales bacterium]|nr:hypothetical protein [Bryobacterales bacterium]